MLLKPGLIGAIFARYLISISCQTVSIAECELKSTFTIFQNSDVLGVEWELGRSLGSYGCNISDKFAIVTHGWGEANSAWIKTLTKNLLKHRGGCVISFEYTDCVDDNDYVASLKQFDAISAVLTKKLNDMENEKISPADIFMYGFSLGARLLVDAAINFGPGRIGSIDVCEPANIGFDMIYKKDPKDAAKNVQCIFSSSYAGSIQRNRCHQNWLMGNCGTSLPGSNDPAYMLCFFTKTCKRPPPINSHAMCNDLYNSAFENNFYASKTKFCLGASNPGNIPADFKMGYFVTRKDIRGVFPAPTAKRYPYNII